MFSIQTAGLHLQNKVRGQFPSRPSSKHNQQKWQRRPHLRFADLPSSGSMSARSHLRVADDLGVNDVGRVYEDSRGPCQ